MLLCVVMYCMVRRRDETSLFFSGVPYIFVVSHTSLFRDDLLLQLFVAGKEGVGAGPLLFEHTCFFRVLRLLFIPFCCLLFQFLVFSCNLIAYMYKKHLILILIEF